MGNSNVTFLAHPRVGECLQLSIGNRLHLTSPVVEVVPHESIEGRYRVTTTTGSVYRGFVLNALTAERGSHRTSALMVPRRAVWCIVHTLLAILFGVILFVSPGLMRYSYLDQNTRTDTFTGDHQERQDGEWVSVPDPGR